MSSYLGAAPAAETEQYAPIKLRGYGTLSGTSTSVQINGAAASILKIGCDSEEKAGVLQAKYLSDLQLLPGVNRFDLSNKNGTVPAYEIRGQGAVLAARNKTVVTILSAPSQASLKRLDLRAFPSGHSGVAFKPEAAVPMFLDRWDRHGMRFYYGPFTNPKGPDGKPIKNYDPSQDVSFAKNEGNCGLLVWQGPFPTEPAEGIMKTSMWEWVTRACEKAGLPTGVNTDMGKPGSLYNRYREQMIQHQPQYLGGYYGLMSVDEGIFSWSATEAREAALAVSQQTIRQFKHVDNIVNWLEPQGEMGHGAPDNLIEYGPQADRGYREFLKTKYPTVQAVAQRWFGDEKALGSWDDVRVPELASFAGWGKDAIDLTGTWRISHDAPYGQASAAPAFDDSAWPTLTAPGHAIAVFLPRKPAVFRRHISIDPAWRQAHQNVWLYVWDLSDTRAKKDSSVPTDTLAFLNGTALSEAAPSTPRIEGHWAAYDVSSVLTAGDNTVAIDLPQGFCNYRVYLAPQQPRIYPDLGPKLNAQWADFIDWGSWSRGKAVRRGAQMIRQVDPDRPITFMSPDTYAADIKQACEDYGGVFHNTGYMAGVWADFHCMEMQSADLPTDLEPGSGAKTLAEFKGFMGKWSTEGIQGVDYFMHIGDVEWNDEIRNYFHDSINLWHLIGKYHVPKAQIALLSSDRVNRLTGFPWRPDPKRFPLGGHWPVRLNELLLPEYAREEVFEQDFDRGHTDAYKVIIDTSTSVLDGPFLAKIENWVKAGGIFVTYGQTGRHTSTDMDSWPISKLSGYAVLNYDKPARGLQLAADQAILKDTSYWTAKSTGGLTLKKEQPECRDLMLWDDGTVAIGMRPVGKGFVVQVGARLGNPDALQFFKGLMDFANIARIPASADGALMRHFVTNNGLYDVWAMWNTKAVPLKTNLVFRNGLRPKSALDVKTGKPVALESGTAGLKVALAFEPLETRVLLTPRDEITAAPARWFKLQRNWWRGTTDPGPTIPPFQAKLTVNLQRDWAFKPLEGKTATEEGQTLSDPKLDDSAWEKRSLGIFTIPDHPNVRHGLFRKQFTVPAGWTGQHVSLWIQEWHGSGYMEKGRTFLDGKPITVKKVGGAPTMDNTPIADGGVAGSELDGVLKAGTSHTLAIEIWGEGPVIGSAAAAWIAYRPDAAAEQDLAGNWTAAVDGLSYGAPVAIPGDYTGIALRRMVKVDAARSAQNAVVRVEAEDRSIHGVIVNGTWVTRFHHYLGTDFDLNVTPYVKFGEENEIIVMAGDGKHSIKNVSLNFYDKNVYP